MYSVPLSPRRLSVIYGVCWPDFIKAMIPHKMYVMVVNMTLHVCANVQMFIREREREKAVERLGIGQARASERIHLRVCMQEANSRVKY